MNKWLAEEDRMLKQLYPDHPNREIAQRLGRSYLSIKNRANILGLQKSTAYMAKRPGCFRKGHGTWNAGISWHSGGRSAETQFKPGIQPHTTVPVGTEVITKDGYIRRKVRDDAPPNMSRKNWEFVHVIEWERHNGPLPKGHIVRFSDGDNRNLAPDNLVAVSRRENAVINRWMAIKEMPPGGLHALMLAARIKIKAKELKEKAA